MTDTKTFNIDGVNCFVDSEGTAWLKLEDCAHGLGLTQRHSKNGKEYESIRWERVFKYLNEIGFPPDVGENGDIDLDAFIPEYIFYRLGMKVNNPIGNAFQDKIARVILPAIRKTGTYSVKKDVLDEYPDGDPISRSLLLAQRLLVQETEDSFRAETEIKRRLSKTEGKVSDTEEDVLILKKQNLFRDYLAHANQIQLDHQSHALSFVSAGGDPSTGIMDTVERFARMHSAEFSSSQEARAFAYNEIYGRIERTEGISLSRRVKNIKIRMRKEGATATQIAGVRKIFVIRNVPELWNTVRQVLKEFNDQYFPPVCHG